MVVRRRFLRWLWSVIKPAAVLYALVLLLVYVSPTVRLERGLEMWLGVYFVDQAGRWTWGMPLLFLGLCLAWFGRAGLRQLVVNHRLGRRGTVRLLLPRQDATIGVKDAVQFWNQVSDLIPKHQHITFELAGNNQEVTFAVCADAGANRALVMQAIADWPGTQSRPVTAPTTDPLFVAAGRPAYTITLQPKQADRPLDTAVADPLAAPLAEISRLPQGTRGGLLLLVRGDDVTRQRLGTAAAQESATRTTGRSLAQKRALKAADARAQHIFLEVHLVVWAAAATPAMARSVARSLARSVKAQYEASNPLVVAAEHAGRPRRVFPLLAGRPWTDAELATLAHLEGKTGVAIAPQLATAPARPLPPSSACRIPREARIVTSLAGGEG